MVDLKLVDPRKVVEELETLARQGGSYRFKLGKSEVVERPQRSRFPGMVEVALINGAVRHGVLQDDVDTGWFEWLLGSGEWEVGEVYAERGEMRINGRVEPYEGIELFLPGRVAISGDVAIEFSKAQAVVHNERGYLLERRDLRKVVGRDERRRVGGAWADYEMLRRLLPNNCFVSDVVLRSGYRAAEMQRR